MALRSRSLRRARNALVSMAVAGSGLAAFAAAGGVAHAATPNSFTPVMSCTSVTGKATYSPGLLKTRARPTTATVLASFTGCSGEFGAPGTGTLFATLSGKASLANRSFVSGGTFTIGWPSGLNPSSGTVVAYESNGVEYVNGQITSGALVGAPISFAYVTTSQAGVGTWRHPVKAQKFINTLPLTVSENFG